MKTLVRCLVTLMAITVGCQAGLALAEDFYWASSTDQTANAAGAEKTAGQGQSAWSSCCPDQSCDACSPCVGGLGCEAEPAFGIVGAAGLDSFRNIADKTQSNFGEVTSLNAGLLIPGAEDFGLGWQSGISYGVYDFDGRITGGDDPARTQQQVFVTTGFYRKAGCDQRVSFGLVYDWMLNNEWGYYGRTPTLGQWRGQIEYAVTECNGVGVWGAQRDLGSRQVDRPYTYENRAISQLNVFWHHKFACTAADSWLWFGIPDHGRMNQTPEGGGSLGDWTIGAAVQVPLSDRLAVYANGSYMHPSAAAGYYASIDNTYDLSVGVAWYFGGHARSCSLFGKGFIPYMPLANNSNFLVEQHVH